MKKVKIYGAGSIGNHLAFASRSVGWDVLICDVDADALERTKTQIYPERYGKWDNSIRLSLVQDVPKEEFDIVIIGTPPDTHLDLAIDILKKERPQILLIEKPLCIPTLENAQTLHELAAKSETIVCVGYNHTLTKNTVETEELLRRGIGECITMNAAFQEHWGGIFKAHPWLAGPHETYLGFSRRGGGACGEHSHAINLWQHFAHVLNLGKIKEVFAFMDFVGDGGRIEYDRICNINVKTEKGYSGLIIQDVVTEPPKKYLRIQGTGGFVEWYANYDSRGDAIISQHKGEAINTTILPGKRPDDFKWEVEHLQEIMEGNIDKSPISLERGLDTMMVIAAAHLSHQRKRVTEIDYSKGYLLDSIKAI